MARCLIFGSSGVLANCLASEFVHLGIEVLGVRRSYFERKSIFKAQSICDYKPQSIAEIINKTSPQFIVNTVAEINLEKCQSDYQRAFKANIEVPMNLTAAMQMCNVQPYLIHISTDNVYSHKGFSTENETLCLNNYAFSKLMGEAAFADSEALIIRTNYLAKTQTENTYLDWVLKSIQSNRKVNLYSDVKFNATSVANIAENILIGMENKSKGTVNLGSKGSWTKANFYLAASSMYGVEFNFSLSKCPQTLVPRPLDMRMNTERAQNLGFKILNKYDVLDACINGETYDV